MLCFNLSDFINKMFVILDYLLSFGDTLKIKVKLQKRFLQLHKYKFAQSAGAVEYTDCFSAERTPPNECAGIWH